MERSAAAPMFNFVNSRQAPRPGRFDALRPRSATSPLLPPARPRGFLSGNAHPNVRRSIFLATQEIRVRRASRATGCPTARKSYRGPAIGPPPIDRRWGVRWGVYRHTTAMAAPAPRPREGGRGWPVQGGERGRSTYTCKQARHAAEAAFDVRAAAFAPRGRMSTQHVPGQQVPRQHVLRVLLAAPPAGAARRVVAAILAARRHRYLRKRLPAVLTRLKRREGARYAFGVLQQLPGSVPLRVRRP